MTIETRLEKIISEILGVKPEKINEHTRIDEDLAADSLDRVELAIGIENEFDIEASDDEMDACKTVRDILGLIHKKQNT